MTVTLSADCFGGICSACGITASPTLRRFSSCVTSGRIGSRCRADWQLIGQRTLGLYDSPRRFLRGRRLTAGGQTGERCAERK